MDQGLGGRVHQDALAVDPDDEARHVADRIEPVARAERRDAEVRALGRELDRATGDASGIRPATRGVEDTESCLAVTRPVGARRLCLASARAGRAGPRPHRPARRSPRVRRARCRRGRRRSEARRYRARTAPAPRRSRRRAVGNRRSSGRVPRSGGGGPRRTAVRAPRVEHPEKR